MMDEEIIGKRIKNLMKTNKLTIKELAKRMKISSKTLTKKLKGEQEFYSSEIIKIIEVFKLDNENTVELLKEEKKDELKEEVFN